MIKPTTTTSTTQQAPQIKPQVYVWGFTAPRDANTPFPPYSLRAAEELLFQAKTIPPELTYFDENFFGYIYGANENVAAAVTLAGMLFRGLEAEGSKNLNLAKALCLLLREGEYCVEMIRDSAYHATVETFGQEVK